MLSAAGLAQALGGRREGVHWMARCPAHADRTPSLAIRDGNAGVLIHCHAGCPQEAVVAALKARGLWETYTPIARRPALTESARKYVRSPLKHWVEPAKTVARPPSERRENLQRPAALSPVAESNMDRAIDLWCASVDPRGTPAEAYLRSRELELPDDPARVLRFHPACPWPRGGTQPCLVALFTDIITDEPRAIHRIAFDLEPPHDGQGKAMLGPVGGCAVKLSADEDVTHGLSIAEGIETALAIYCWGWRPIWALGSAGGIDRFPVLPGIEALSIFADNDESGTGLKVAKAAQRRWCDAGAEARVLMPKGKGVDWADEWGVR